MCYFALFLGNRFGLEKRERIRVFLDGNRNGAWPQLGAVALAMLIAALL
jgi:hypothetical protein